MESVSRDIWNVTADLIALMEAMNSVVQQVKQTGNVLFCIFHKLQEMIIIWAFFYCNVWFSFSIESFVLSSTNNFH